MLYELKPATEINGWRVGALGDGGEVHTTLFAGPDAEQRATEYFEWKSASEPNALAYDGSQLFNAQNFFDQDGDPAGGFATAIGIDIRWQNGPLGRCVCEPGTCPGSGHGCERRLPNGAFVETLLYIVRSRLEWYQSSKFKSEYNAVAIEKIMEALDTLNRRTQTREARGVEGTHVQ